MTREEAQAHAERSVLEWARAGHLARLARPGRPLLLEGAKMMVTGMRELLSEMEGTNRFHSGIITALAALCIEVVRESILIYGIPEEGTTYGEHRTKN